MLIWSLYGVQWWHINGRIWATSLGCVAELVDRCIFIKYLICFFNPLCSISCYTQRLQEEEQGDPGGDGTMQCWLFSVTGMLHVQCLSNPVCLDVYSCTPLTVLLWRKGRRSLWIKTCYGPRGPEGGGGHSAPQAPAVLDHPGVLKKSRRVTVTMKLPLLQVGLSDLEIILDYYFISLVKRLVPVLYFKASYCISIEQAWAN